jgi:hypothetical protein
MGEGSRGWHRQELEFPPLTPELLKHLAAWTARVQGWAVIYSDFESAHLWRDACAAALAEYVRAELVEIELAEHADDCALGLSALAGCDCGADPGPGYSGLLPWERWSQPQKTGDRPTQGFEVLSMFWGRRGSRKAWNGPGSLTCLRHKALRGTDKHRTEKPLDQALDLVSWLSSGPGLPWGADAALGLAAATVAGRTMTAKPAQDHRLPVIDPCGGSGTIATACALLDRDCVSFELLPEWAEKGERRALDALRGVLSDRDRERAERWVLAAIAEAEAVPFPKAADGSDVKTWERAQRRLYDAHRVGDKL